MCRRSFLLYSLGYASPYFLSFRQVTGMGGRVKKVVFVLCDPESNGSGWLEINDD